MKAHQAHWWVWLLLAAAVIAANEVVDRVGFDESHWRADIILGVVVVAIASYVSNAKARRRRSTA
jgi:hypothetical protein